MRGECTYLSTVCLSTRKGGYQRAHFKHAHVEILSLQTVLAMNALMTSDNDCPKVSLGIRVGPRNRASGTAKAGNGNHPNQ